MWDQLIKLPQVCFLTHIQCKQCSYGFSIPIAGKGRGKKQKAELKLEMISVHLAKHDILWLNIHILRLSP